MTRIGGTHFGNNNSRYVEDQINLSPFEASYYLLRTIFLGAVDIVDYGDIVSKFG